MRFPKSPVAHKAGSFASCSPGPWIQIGSVPSQKYQRTFVYRIIVLQWRHNELDGISNHQLTIVSSTVYSDADLVPGIRRWPVNSPHKRPVTRKMLPFDDVIMRFLCIRSHKHNIYVCPSKWQKTLNTQLCKAIAKCSTPTIGHLGLGLKTALGWSVICELQCLSQWENTLDI